MSIPAISVVMASYNGATHLAATVESILCQSFDDFELIVVDDCSTDETRHVLGGFSDPRLHVLAMPDNAGPVAARNRACEAARGRYLAALDQDDLVHPERFAAQLRHLEANPGCAAVGTATCHLRDGQLLRGAGPARTTPDFLRWMLQTRNPLVWSSMMIRRAALAEAGKLNRDEFRFAEDFDLYHRLCEVGDVSRLDEVLTIYRSHGAGASCRYRGRMMTSASAVLTRAYAPWFGVQAAHHARLIIRHVAGGEAVADANALYRLTKALCVVHDGFNAQHTVNEESRMLIDEERSRQWWRIARAGLRAGTLTANAIRSARPDFVRRSGIDAADLFCSAIIGNLRRNKTLDDVNQSAEAEHSGLPHLAA